MMFRGKMAAAKTRLLLLLLQLDQCSCDRGSWTLASELSLEHPPPFSSMGLHVPPEGEQPFSKLLDPRWAEVALSHLRDTDDYVSKRRGLQKLPKKGDEDGGGEGPKRRAKSKAKPKAAAAADMDA